MISRPVKCRAGPDQEEVQRVQVSVQEHEIGVDYRFDQAIGPLPCRVRRANFYMCSNAFDQAAGSVATPVRRIVK
jgi:hypothetical protein